MLQDVSTLNIVAGRLIAACCKYQMDFELSHWDCRELQDVAEYFEH